MRSLLIVSLLAASLLAGGAAALVPDHRLFVQQAAVSGGHRCRGAGTVSTGRQPQPGHRQGFASSPLAPPSAPQASPRESFDYWHKLYARAYAGVEVGLPSLVAGRARGAADSRAPNTPPPRPPPQEYERRFMVWLDNLKFVLDYNARHTSHWVRRRRCRRLLLPGFHVRRSAPVAVIQVGAGCMGQWQQRLAGGATAAAPLQRTACLPMRRRPTHRAAAAAPCPSRACSWA